MKYLIVCLGDIIEDDPVSKKNQRGSVMISKLPDLKEFHELNIGLGGIKKICINHKDQILFAIGFDNSLYFIEFKEKEWAIAKDAEGDGLNLKEEFLYEE